MSQLHLDFTNKKVYRESVKDRSCQRTRTSNSYQNWQLSLKIWPSSKKKRTPIYYSISNLTKILQKFEQCIHFNERYRKLHMFCWKTYAMCSLLCSAWLPGPLVHQWYSMATRTTSALVFQNYLSSIKNQKWLSPLLYLILHRTYGKIYTYIKNVDCLIHLYISETGWYI